MIELKDKVVLVIAPHPDDEVFGCGGFISRLKREGATVNVLYVAIGDDQHFGKGGGSNASTREQEIERVVKFMGIDDYAIAFRGQEYFLKLDNHPLGMFLEMIERGTSVSIASKFPDIILTPDSSDYNQDHRVIANATIGALRPADPTYRPFVPSLFHYELPYAQWSVDKSLPASNMCVRLDEADLEFKVEAMKLYQSQLKTERGPLSIRGIQTHAAYRGIQAGCDYAECYATARLVV